MVMISSVNLIRHSDLGSVTSGQHHTQAHQATHASGGNDVITKMARIATGSYTGDGTTSQAITGVGFAPKYVVITLRYTATDQGFNPNTMWWTTDVIMDDISGGNGAAFTTQQSSSQVDMAMYDDAIIALGSDGFTVDDDGTDRHPNALNDVYNYMAIG